MEFEPSTNLEWKDYITFIGIGLTFIISLISLFVSFFNTKKTLYINSVTASRIKWIGTIRENISEYCGLIHHCSLTDLKSENEKEMFQQIDKLKYLIMLQLNREDPFDKEMIAKIDNLWRLSEYGSEEEIKTEIASIVDLTQDLLKLEWEGAKLESMNGILSKEEKDELYEKHLKIKKP